MLLGLAVAVTFTFAGGDDHALVSSLGQQLGGCAAMVTVSRREWRPINEREETRGKLLDSISLARPFRLISGRTDRVIAAVTPGIHRYLLDRDNASIYLLHMKNPPEVIRPNGTGNYTFRSGRASVPGLAHFELPARRRLRWHWLFDNHRFAISVRQATAKQLLECLAEAAGGKVLEQEEVSYVDVDWARFRRSIKEWADEQKGTEFDGYQKAQLLSLWVAAASEAQLAKFFASPSNRVEINASSDARHKTLVREAVQNCMSMRGFGEFIDKVGKNPELYFTVQAKGKVSIRLHNRQTNHSFVF
jgi:hypothetical protein